MGRGNRSTEQVADAIAYVCENIGHLRATLKRGSEDDLDELLVALRDGSDPVDLLEAVHRALRRAQDAVGVFGRNRDASRLAGIQHDRPREQVLLCPRVGHPCTRYAWPGGDPTPVCAVTDAPLRRATLAP